ncbi:hypothetical protein LQ564_21810 [Massilia sp. G4R7]|uniref:Uncharacterized protein n=1 Tax=Massilia phyllostachyos TaxID=2898585 RepID=A0ABS8QB11_9BURK|nr:hypothetical protein [Massilia phyllostachyos]MCD2518940.1 hypothetical protein [Massilia phyllostachyos]
MRITLFLSSCLLLAGAHAAEVKRVDARTIAFDGSITAGDAAKLAQAWAPGTTLLRVTSVGGSSEEAMIMGRFIHDKGLDIEIVRGCASSCANYMFPAARHKTITPGAILGYHGTGYLTELAGVDSLREDLLAGGMAPDEVKKQLPGLHDYVVRIARMEQEFTRYIGLNPQFYRDFKTVAEKGDALDKQYAAQKATFLWWPSARRLEQCYGIRNVNDQARPAALESTGHAFVTKGAFLLVGDQFLAGCGS